MTRASGDQPPLGAADFAALFRPLATLPGPILAAVSGGPDSTALLHGLAAWSRAEPGRPPLVAATVDHGLRAAARDEAEAVGAAAAALGVPHHILTWTRPDGGAVSQARARAARYRLLGELAGSLGCAALATAHTLDDQAETVLLRMAAGSGLAGLAAMRPITGRGAVRLHRPLLAVPKARLVATCRAQGWFFATDPSNADPRHARPRWRALMPGLAAEGLDARRLARLA
ncbi:tRNA lysidine(34) synthetase TilS, partial [Enterovirga sp.]|uniref:tRNA lysidine(34) synthetase TilS n=1 Tax=Enterovirga sp. TaxID=2026350 RepID=UPI00261319C1